MKQILKKELLLLIRQLWKNKNNIYNKIKKVKSKNKNKKLKIFFFA